MRKVGGHGEDRAGTDKDKTQKRFLPGHSTRTGKDGTCLYLLTFVARKLPLSSRTPRALSRDYLSWPAFNGCCRLVLLHLDAHTPSVKQETAGIHTFHTWYLRKRNRRKSLIVVL